MITIKKAREIANAWHGGQWSQLYSFASSGLLPVENALLITEEITQEILRPETALKPFFMSKADMKQLQQLRAFVMAFHAKENNTVIAIQKDSYGLDLPVLWGTNHNVLGFKRLQ